MLAFIPELSEVIHVGGFLGADVGGLLGGPSVAKRFSNLANLLLSTEDNKSAKTNMQKTKQKT